METTIPTSSRLRLYRGAPNRTTSPAPDSQLDNAWSAGWIDGYMRGNGFIYVFCNGQRTRLDYDQVNAFLGALTTRPAS